MGRAPNELTPAMRQYIEAKAQVPDSLLLFRMGDFYEVFFEDAVEASRILEIALTTRDRNSENPVPMCGVPHHALNTYMNKLLQAGRKVAVCEQMEDPSQAQGIVRREIVRVLSPGVVLDMDALESDSNNYIAVVFSGLGGVGLSFCDVSTGVFRACLLPEASRLTLELGRIEPREILVQESADSLQKRIRTLSPNASIRTMPDSDFTDIAAARKNLAKVTDPSALAPEVAVAAGTLASYLASMARTTSYPLNELEVYESKDFMVLDETAVADLELFRTIVRNEKRLSLLWAIDRTVTPMGARWLRQQMAYPLVDSSAINARLDAVQCLVQDSVTRSELHDCLRPVSDIERLTTRVVTGQATPRELLSLSRSVLQMHEMGPSLARCQAALLAQAAACLKGAPQPVVEAATFVEETAPNRLGESRLFKRGYDEQLDELLSLMEGGELWLAGFEARERERTGINSLKVRYNKVFGYYIEVTNANVHLVPSEYVRKQTIANGERYFTIELKEYEDKIVNSEQRILELETRLFRSLLQRISDHRAELLAAAEAIGRVDVWVHLAQVAAENNYVRPVINNGDTIEIRNGRHPVVEACLGQGRFVPNDVLLNGDERQILVITGPNMAGKSTIMRQVALTVVLAQMGSFVPATEASIGVVDRVFTRVGAADSLSQGLSTFMMEMKEASEILKHATRKSLVILDEVGRGTSTYDGLAIAWAITEYLHDFLRCKTLFATHYHELTQLVQYKKRVVNMCVAVKEFNDDILFLHKLIDGAANRSYGVQVARLAGVPRPVIERAKEILLSLEGQGNGELRIERPRPVRDRRPKGPAGPDLFTSAATAAPKPELTAVEASVLARIRRVVPDRLTPIEALNLVFSLYGDLSSGSASQQASHKVAGDAE